MKRNLLINFFLLNFQNKIYIKSNLQINFGYFFGMQKLKIIFNGSLLLSFFIAKFPIFISTKFPFQDFPYHSHVSNFFAPFKYQISLCSLPTFCSHIFS